MFEQDRTVNLFPVPVWAFALTAHDAEAIAGKARDAVETLRAEDKAAGAGAWRSGDRLHTQPAFLVLNGLIKEAAEAVLAKLQVEHGGFRVSALWAAALPPGAASEATAAAAPVAEQASLAGVYSLAAPEPGDTIAFADLRPALRLNGARATEPNPYTARNATISLPPRTLLLFPAWLGYQLSPGTAEAERITLGFTIDLD